MFVIVSKNIHLLHTDKIGEIEVTLMPPKSAVNFILEYWPASRIARAAILFGYGGTEDDFAQAVTDWCNAHGKSSDVALSLFEQSGVLNAFDLYETVLAEVYDVLGDVVGLHEYVANNLDSQEVLLFIHEVLPNAWEINNVVLAQFKHPELVKMLDEYLLQTANDLVAEAKVQPEITIFVISPVPGINLDGVVYRDGKFHTHDISTGDAEHMAQFLVASWKASIEHAAKCPDSWDKIAHAFLETKEVQQ